MQPLHLSSIPRPNADILDTGCNLHHVYLTTSHCSSIRPELQQPTYFMSNYLTRQTSIMAPSQPEVPSGFEPSKWFQPDVQDVPEPARTLFAEYSKIPDEEIAEHINEVVSIAICILRKELVLICIVP